MWQFGQVFVTGCARRAVARFALVNAVHALLLQKTSSFDSDDVIARRWRLQLREMADGWRPPPAVMAQVGRDQLLLQQLAFGCVSTCR